MANILAKSIKEHENKHQTVLSAMFHKHDEDDHLLDEIEIHINLNNIH